MAADEDQPDVSAALSEEAVRCKDTGSSEGGKAKRELSETEWEDGRGYMRVKRMKLQHQFSDIPAAKQSSIFHGVTIYVNGWTDPTADELKRLIHAHGGGYVYNMYSSTSATHIIASNLPNSKVKNIGNKIVCTPDWIVDSVAAGRCLPHQQYQIFSRNSSAQQRLGFTANPKTESQDPSASEAATIGVLNVEQTASRSVPSAAPSTPSAVQAKAYNPSRGTDLVNEFFTHSRLHHLSTWSTELKKFTSEMVTKIKPKHPTLPPAVSLRAKNRRCVVHIDLDCFFVSVSIRDKPHLKGKPVAVTHAKLSPKRSSFPSLEPGAAPGEGNLPKHLLESKSDIASCSYEARASGVRNGMLVGHALKKCPDLQLVSYEFENYRKVAQTFYETLLHYSSTVEAVSCDETYIELTDYVDSFDKAEEMVQELRDTIHSKTNCTVSAGISHNMLLARMATRVAKPDGQKCISLQEADKFIATHSVRDLPGVGYSLHAKLQEQGINTCQDLRKCSIAKLKADFGAKTGQMLFQSARGIDDRPLKVTTERKSVSVDMNFGIRLSDISEGKALIQNLAAELEKRAEDATVLGGTISLKLKIRSPNAPLEAPKYLGHGQCDNITRSVTLLQPTRSSSEIARLSNRLLMQINPTASDIRGVGIQLTKLVSSDSSGDSGSSHGTDLRKILSATASHTEPAHGSTVPVQQSGACAFSGLSSTDQIKPVRTVKTTDESFAIDLPPASQLDSSVLDALPKDLKQKILRGYELQGDRETGITCTTPAINDTTDIQKQMPSSLPMATKTDAPATSTAVADMDIVIGNERLFISECRQYIDNWVAEFSEGPKDEDVVKVCNYLQRLLQTDLEMLMLFLKHFRRVLCRFALKSWYPSFNTILDNIQNEVNALTGGRLAIQKL